MLLRVLLGVLAGRRRLADALSLGWLRSESIDLAVPFAALLVVAMNVDEFGRQVGPVPFAVAWLGLAVILWAALSVPAALRWRGRMSRPAVLLLGLVLALWFLSDWLAIAAGRHLYDLDVYLGSARRWLDGGSAYLTHTLTAWPDNPRDDFFLYPPPLLPVFGLLARLPYPVVATAWTAGMAGCSYAAFRVLGVSRSWSLALLAFPPIFIGFESGNVASLTFLLFALGARAGSTLVVNTLFKVQSGVPILWLVRERRFRALLGGGAATLAIVLATLPLVGVEAWRQWWNGLGYRAASQLDVPSLYGYSHAQWMPPLVFAVTGAALIVLALAFRGRRGLAAFGLVSIFVSPSLWPHGFAFALPAIFLLERDAAVLAILGTGALGRNMWLLFYAGWLAVLAARREPSGALHPMADAARQANASGSWRRAGARPAPVHRQWPHSRSPFPAESAGMLEAQAPGPSREEP